MTAPTFADRVQETFTTTGTGTISLGGAVLGYQAFGTVLTDAQTCRYMATDGTSWEVGLGTYAVSGNTLARTTINASSNANSAVSWAAGTKNIMLVFAAADINSNVAVTVGSTTISSGNTGRILYDNAGVIGELATTGSGNVVLATSPTLVTPALGTPASGDLSNCTGIPTPIMTPLGVGSTVWAKYSTAVTAGQTVTGSGLTVVTINSAGGSSATGDVVSGTWQAMTSSINSNQTLEWQRIA